VRVDLLKEEFGDQLKLDWRAFLLRPQPGNSRDLEKFKNYTRHWLKIAEDKPSGEFRKWQSDAGPPSHSVPPHLVAKAAAELSAEAFDRIHNALLKELSDEDLEVDWGNS
jgi:hypothetical protein